MTTVWRRDRDDTATSCPAVLVTGDRAPDRPREGGRLRSRWVDGALWLLAVAFVLERLVEVHRSGSYGADFGVVWNSAKNFLHHGSHWSGYAYPPSSLLFVWPVALVPFRLARAAMFPLSLLVVAVSSVAVIRLLVDRPLSSRTWALTTIGLAAFFPVTHLLQEQNLTMVLLPLYVCSLWLAKRERWIWCGAVLGFSLALKPLMLPMIIPLIVARKWRAAGVALVIPVVTNLIALPLIRDPRQLVRELLGTFGGNINVPDIESIAGVGRINHLSGGVILGLQAAVAVAGIVALVAIARRRRHELTDVVTIIELTSVGILVQCLDFTFSWDFYLVLLLPLAAVVVVPRSAGRSLLLWLAIALAGIHVVYDVQSGHEVAAYRWEDVRSTAGILLALVALLLWGLGVEWPNRWIDGRVRQREPASRGNMAADVSPPG